MTMRQSRYSDQVASTTAADDVGGSTLARWAPLIIMLAVSTAYANSFNAPFTFDDNPAIVENPHVRSLWPLTRAMSAPQQSSVAGRPMVSLSLAVSYALFGMTSWGFRLQNIVVHVLAALTLYGIVRRTMLLPHPHCEGDANNAIVQANIKRRAAATPLALFVALLWAVHPLQTQSVTYIIQRAESMVGLFYLLTLYCFIRSLDVARPLPWRFGAVIACALGMATKEVMVTAPVVILIYDRIFVSASFRELFRRRWSIHAALAGTWLILFCLMIGGPRSATTGFALKKATALEYAASEFGVIAHYLRLTFWPIGQCLDYGWPVARTMREIVPPMLLILVLVSVTIWALRRKPRLGYLGVWFFIILAPTSSFVPIEDLAFEHRMYLPLAAVCAAVVFVAYRLLVRNVDADQTHFRSRVGTAFAASSIIFLMALTLHRNHDYRADEAGTDYLIWADVMHKRPDNPRGYDNAGNALYLKGHYDGAIALFQQALSLKADDDLAHYNLGSTLESLGRIDEAVEHYRAALRIDSGRYRAHYNLGRILLQQQHYAEATEEFRATLEIQPDFPDAQNNLAIALAQQGQLDAAIETYRTLFETSPDFLDARLNLAMLLLRKGASADAAVQLREVLRIQPGNEQAQRMLEQLQIGRGG